MEKKSSDNVSVIFIAFKNFEQKMKNPDFEYNFSSNIKFKEIPDFYDLGDVQKPNFK